MDNQPLHLITEFREHAGMPHPNVPRVDGLFIDCKKHAGFIEEEAGELLWDTRDSLPDDDRIIAAADALCDISVFLNHAICDFGLGRLFGTLFKEVDRSNRTKGDGNGNFFEPRTKKLIKGEGYTPPDLRQFFSGELSVETRICSTLLVNDTDEFARFNKFVSFAIGALSRHGDVSREVLDDGRRVRWELTDAHHLTLARLANECGDHEWCGSLFYLDVMTAKGVSVDHRHVRTYEQMLSPSCITYTGERLDHVDGGLRLVHE